jgi:hypothetical protein
MTYKNEIKASEVRSRGIQSFKEGHLKDWQDFIDQLYEATMSVYTPSFISNTHFVFLKYVPPDLSSYVKTRFEESGFEHVQVQPSHQGVIVSFYMEIPKECETKIKEEPRP